MEEEDREEGESYDEDDDGVISSDTSYSKGIHTSGDDTDNDRTSNIPTSGDGTYNSDKDTRYVENKLK